MSAAEKWPEFQEWAKRNGWSQERLADEAGTSRAHLNQVLGGHRSGGHTWRRIVRVLPWEGLLLLQQCAAWNNFAERALAERREREKLIEIGRRCRETMEVGA